jgi:hypothetical protein
MHTQPPRLAGIEDYAVWSVLWRQYAIKAGYGTALTAELEAGADLAAGPAGPSRPNFVPAP